MGGSPSTPLYVAHILLPALGWRGALPSITPAEEARVQRARASRPQARGPSPDPPAGPPLWEALTQHILPGKPALLLPAKGAQSPRGLTRGWSGGPERRDTGLRARGRKVRRRKLEHKCCLLFPSSGSCGFPPTPGSAGRRRRGGRGDDPRSSRAGSILRGRGCRRQGAPGAGPGKGATPSPAVKANHGG